MGLSLPPQHSPSTINQSSHHRRNFLKSTYTASVKLPLKRDNMPIELVNSLIIARFSNLTLLNGSKVPFLYIPKLK